MSPAFQLITGRSLVQERPFTHPAHTEADHLTLRYLAARLRATRDQADSYAHWPIPVVLYCPEPDQRQHRQVLVRPFDLFGDRQLPVVGFFGQTQAGADRRLLDEVDGQLLAELPSREGLVAYCTLDLRDGNCGNLVIFADAEAKARWRESARHRYAAHELAPAYYASVRIYHGILPRGLSEVDALQFSLVKFYDYRSHPPWRGLRRL